MLTNSLWLCLQAVSSAVSDQAGVCQEKLDFLEASICKLGDNQRQMLENDIQKIIDGLSQLQRRLSQTHAK